MSAAARWGERQHFAVYLMESVAIALRNAGRSEAEIDDAMRYMAAREAGYGPAESRRIADAATPPGGAGSRPTVMTELQVKH